MCFIRFLLKPRKQMAKPHSKRVRVGKYIASSHAQNRIVYHDIKKVDVIGNLIRKPIKITRVKYNSKNEPSYDRIGTRVTTCINPNNNVISTIHKTHTKLRKKGKKHVQKRKTKRKI